MKELNSWRRIVFLNKMEKENKRIKQNKNNRRVNVNRMYLKLFGILFILILLPLVSSATYGDVNSIYSDFTWVDYDDANVEINYGGIDFTYGDSIILLDILGLQ